MVKRKGKAQSRKGAKKAVSSFVAKMKRVILMASAAVVCFIALLFVFNLFNPIGESGDGSRREKRADRQKTEASGSERKAEATRGERKSASGEKSRKEVAVSSKIASGENSKKRSNGSYSFSSGDELPKLTQKRDEQIIRHEGYTVSYNSEYRIANWVAYELTSNESVSRKSERSNKFVPDPMVKGATAMNEDYTRTGYDRGHLAPAGDMRWSAKAMRESFYLSNIAPQKPGLNRGIWKELEEQSRLWAKENGSLLIATGPVIDTDMKRLGKNRVAVPKRFYKVICMIYNGKAEGVGFIFENRDYGKTNLKTMMIPIDEVEREVGINFFHSIPDEVEEAMESRCNPSCWSF